MYALVAEQEKVEKKKSNGLMRIGIQYTVDECFSSTCMGGTFAMQTVQDPSADVNVWLKLLDCMQTCEDLGR